MRDADRVSGREFRSMILYPESRLHCGVVSNSCPERVNHQTDVSTCTAWLSAGHRITFSSLSPSPPELVEVSSSVALALVIKRAGYTHGSGTMPTTSAAEGEEIIPMDMNGYEYEVRKGWGGR